MSVKSVIDKTFADAVAGLKSEWLNTAGTDWYNYVINLPTNARTAYLIIVFHNQVINGGFHQYFTNGYGQFATETIKALQSIGAVHRSKLLRQAFDIVNAESYDDEIFRQRLLEKQIRALFVTDDFFDPLDELDNHYYSIENEDIEQLLFSFLKGQT